MARRKSKKQKPDTPPRPTADAKPRRTRWQRCYGPYWFPTVAVTAGLFAVLELILTMAGVLPANVYEDPYVGFSTTQPLFEPSEPGSPTMATAENKLRFFNYQAFSRKKGKNTYRIFCLGGSTTFGRPYDDNTSFAGWLREMLPAADPSRKWEVINAGGISYASYRIALLVEELAQYDPDMFIIYTGHNEFLEKRTYGHLLKGPGFADTLRGVLGKTRVYTLAKRLQAAPANTGTGNESEGALSSEVVTRLEKSIGPEDYSRETLFEPEVAEHFRFNLDRMVTLTQGAGASVVFVTPAANLRDCSPFKSEHRDGLAGDDLDMWNTHFAHAKEAAAADDWIRAEEELTAAIEVDGQYAHAYYLRGRARYSQGKFDEAKADFIQARDRDVCPLRAISTLVDHVRAVAAARSVPCLDFEALAAERAEHQIPGKDLFLDHVHPTIDGNRLVADAILHQLAEPLALPPDWETGAMPAIASRITGRLDTPAQALALRNLAQVLSWAGKFEEARALALRVLERTPDDPDAHFLVAWGAEAMNESELAESHYREVMRFAPDNPQAPRRLARLLAVKGSLAEALTVCREAVARRPADPELRLQLASLLAESEDYTEAKVEYARVLAMAPDGPDCHQALERLNLQKRSLAVAESAPPYPLAPDSPGETGHERNRGQDHSGSPVGDPQLPNSPSP